MFATIRWRLSKPARSGTTKPSYLHWRQIARETTAEIRGCCSVFAATRRNENLRAAAHAAILPFRGASLYANQACWQLLKERQHRPPLQLAADDHLAAASTPCAWKTDLAMSKPMSLSSAWLAPLNRGGLNRPTSMAPTCRWRGRPQHQKRTYCDAETMSALPPIVLKHSRIAGLRKSRECGALAISAAARLCKLDTSTSDRLCGN